MNAMHCSLLLFLFATMSLGSYICCAAGQIARSSDRSWLSGLAQLSENSYSLSVNPRKTWRHFPSRREIVRRSPWVQRLAFRLPPYDTPHVAPRNNPKFHVDRTHAAGGVCEQTKTALRKYNRLCTELYASQELHLIKYTIQ